MNHVQVKTAAAITGEFLDVALRAVFLTEGNFPKSFLMAVISDLRMS